VADLCGFEIAAMAGFFAAGAAGGATLVVDGLIATAGALVAETFAPGTARAMVAAHRSLEPAHGEMLARLGLEPFLEWELRLGEGTGALLLCGLLDAAAAMCGEMATLESLGIG
jgi:nicotinate-nucleotide--dimethylbenzimidazole phosphoribosyltransferase